MKLYAVYVTVVLAAFEVNNFAVLSAHCRPSLW